MSNTRPRHVYPEHYSVNAYLSTISTSCTTSIGAPIAFTLLKWAKGESIEKTLPLLFLCWAALASTNIWSNWNRVKDRLTPRFVLEEETESTDYNTLIKQHQIPQRQADETLTPGENEDPWLWIKYTSSDLPNSLVLGFLLAYSFTHDYPSEVWCTGGIALGLLNFLKNALTEPFLIFNAHARVNPGLKTLPEQPGFRLLYNDYTYGFARNIVPAGLTLFSCMGLYNVLSRFLPLDLTYVAYIPTLVAYVPMTSALRIFTLGAMKNTLEPAGIKFNMENDLHQTPYWPIAELLACRYLTIDLPLSYQISPTIITSGLVLSTIIAGVLMVYESMEQYLICPGKNCFSQGKGSLLDFIFSVEPKDHPYLVAAFAITITTLIGMTYISGMSQYANIQNYIEGYKKEHIRAGEDLRAPLLTQPVCVFLKEPEITVTEETPQHSWSA